MIGEDVKKQALKAQESEITEHHIYNKLAGSMPEGPNRTLLEEIARDEYDHYEFWKRFTGEDVAPLKAKVFFYWMLGRIFGLSFSLKLMEKGEDAAQVNYEKLKELDPHVESVIKDEERHELEVLDLIDEEKLKYVGSMVLGLNDALVELLGALSGFTLALQNTRLIAVVGLITGIAAAMSMAGSEYLSSKEEGDKNPKVASVYTGFAYFITVCFLIFPFFLFKNPFASLATSVLLAVLIILTFTFYTSVARNLSFKTKFREMISISLGVAVLSFIVGLLVRTFFGIDV
ncbi:MAG: VIT1/CCC1 transporter family protein [Candidatus Omnitrophota bacterium]